MTCVMIFEIFPETFPDQRVSRLAVLLCLWQPERSIDFNLGDWMRGSRLGRGRCFLLRRRHRWRKTVHERPTFSTLSTGSSPAQAGIRPRSLVVSCKSLCLPVFTSPASYRNCFQWDVLAFSVRVHARRAWRMPSAGHGAGVGSSDLSATLLPLAS